MYVSSASSVSRCTGVAARGAKVIVGRGAGRSRIVRGMGSEAAWQQGAGIANAIAPFTGPAAPFVQAAAQLVSIFAQIFSGCGATCTQATTYANQAGAQLDTLKAQYFALPTPRPYEAQQAFLQACNQIFGWLQQMCGNPALGKAGQRCIAERLTRRPCPSTLNDSNMGGGQIKFCDYWSYFYDPVANDPDVAPPPSPATSAVSSVGSAISSALPASVSGLLTTSVFGLPLWLIGAGGLALLWAASE